METEILATGAIPSKTDYRDDIVASAALGEATTLPEKFHTDLGKVLMQAKTPSCVAHSVVELIRLYWFKKSGKWIDFSPRFLDILSSESWIPLDGGRVPRTVLKLATVIGCCTTDLLPNDTALTIAQYRNPNVITAAMMTEAAKYRIPGYISVRKDQESTRKAIYLYGGISSLFDIGNELWTPSWNAKDICPLRIPKSIVSGHQMTPNGWDNSTDNRLLNHWSTDWAEKGEAPYNHANWQAFNREQWAIAEIPKDTKEFLKNLPSPVDFHYQWNKDLKYGEQNEDIKFAQVAFMILGFMEPVKPDELGIFGPKTKTANEKFQKANKIAPYPESIGPLTRRALNQKFAI